MREVDRYHPAFAILHWLLAIMIVGALLFGFFVLAPMPNSSPEKIGDVRLHMVGGVLILALMAVRLLARGWLARRRSRPVMPGSTRSLGSCMSASISSSSRWRRRGSRQR